jgi:hypothetical protein
LAAFAIHESADRPGRTIWAIRTSAASLGNAAYTCPIGSETDDRDDAIARAGTAPETDGASDALGSIFVSATNINIIPDLALHSIRYSITTYERTAGVGAKQPLSFALSEDSKSPHHM